MPARLCRAIARSAVQKQPERRARMFLCLPAAEQAANGWRKQPCPTTNRLCRAIARSAVQKQPERRARMFLCLPAAEQAANGWRKQPCPTTNRLCRAIARSAVQKQPERRALRPQARFGAQPPQAALGAEIGCSSVHPPPNRRRMGEGDNLALLLGGSSKPRTTANRLSPRRAKLALNVRIGCSCRAHNHHKFSHRFLQPHTKRRASHAD